QATVLQQETNRIQQEQAAKFLVAQWQALATQQKTNQLLLTQAAQGWAELRDLIQRLISPKRGDVAPHPIRASNVLQKMTLEDNVKAYLLIFERCAEQEAWPRAQWASIIAPFLVGDTQKAYFDLEPKAASDYIQLKAKILARAGLTATVWAQHFHAWRFQEGKVPRSQMFDLIHLARRWLQLDTNNHVQIIEILVMNRFLRGLPPTVRKWVGQRNLANAQELINVVARQLTVEELTRTPFVAGVRNSRRPLSLKNGTSSGTSKTVLGKGAAKEWSQTAKCCQCNKLGYTVVHCPMNRNPWNVVVNVVNSVEGTRRFMRPIKVNGKETMALTDTGSTMTLISSTLVKSSVRPHLKNWDYLRPQGHYYPTTRVQKKKKKSHLYHRVGVIPKLPHLAILGQD
uniref:SCAN box domain-containing protein n=1 Tax=Latimeria chalumnae TaxID=7897 RepID=H3B4I4_LATCH